MATELVQLEGLFQPLLPRFEQVLKAPGVSIDASRLIASVVSACERNRELLKCTPQSLINASMSAAWLGLPVDGVTGQAFLVPYGTRAQLVIGYKGYNTLAARSGITITGDVVRDGDTIDIDLGSGVVIHKPAWRQRGPMLGVWARAASNTRPPVVKTMNMQEIAEVKAKSPGARKTESPWNDPNVGFPAMAEKTVKRRLARSLPLDIMTIAAALEQSYEEEGKHAYINERGSIVIEGHSGNDAPSAHALIGDPQRDLEPPARVDDIALQVASDLGAVSRQLADAAKLGTEALTTAWSAIQDRDTRLALKSELDSVHKPNAAAVDREVEENI